MQLIFKQGCCESCLSNVPQWKITSVENAVLLLIAEVSGKRELAPLIKWDTSKQKTFVVQFKIEQEIILHAEEDGLPARPVIW